MADLEDNYYICQATEPLDEEGRFINKRVICRYKEGVVEVQSTASEISSGYKSNNQKDLMRLIRSTVDKG